MNKKLLYLFLIVAGLFMGKTANAVTVTLTDDLEVPGYVKSNYFDLVAHTLNGENFATDDQSLFNLVDANIDNEKNNFSVFRDNYGIQNQQTSSRIVTIYKSLSKGDIVIVQGGCTGQYGTAIDVLNADAETINGAEDYSCFIMTSNAESLEISLGRLTYISAILIMTKDASADELEVAKSNYASAVTAYNSAKDAAVVDEEFVDDTKLFLLVSLSVESPNHFHARKVLPGYPVDGVEELLDDFETWHEERDETENDPGNDDDRGSGQKRQLPTRIDDLANRPDGHDRGFDELGRSEGDDHLDLRNVVCRPCQKGGGREIFDVGRIEVGYMIENSFSQVIGHERGNIRRHNR